MVRNFSRSNGWNWPPHPLQVLAWLLLLFLMLMTFGLLISSVHSLTARIALHVIFGLTILITVIINVVVTTVDPADDSVRSKVREGPRPNFDRQQHRHVIDENFFCNICETSIHPSSKHCRQCNKCVLDFDHHCKWLNNCVGARNYKMFLFYVISTTVASFFISILSITIFSLYFALPDRLLKINGNFTIFGAQINETTWLALVSLTAIVSCIIFALTLHLLLFHLRLLIKGLTTYNFIMQQKRDLEQSTRTVDSNSKTVNNGVPKGEPQKQPPISLMGRLKSMCKKKNIQKNGVAGVNPNNGNFLQVSSKQKNEVIKDVIPVDDVSITQHIDINRKATESLISNTEHLPPINNHQIKQRFVDNSYETPSKLHRTSLPPLHTRRTSTNSNIPYENVDKYNNIKGTVPSSIDEEVDDLQRNSNVPVLPPVPMKYVQSTRLYEPVVESVFLTDSSKELTLPTIDLHPPEPESSFEDLNEIPASVFNKNVSSPRADDRVMANFDVNFSNASNTYFATGQFTVAYRQPNIITANFVQNHKPNIWFTRHGTNEGFNNNEETRTIISTTSSSSANSKRVRFVS